MSDLLERSVSWTNPPGAPNIELLDEHLARIKARPELWIQSWWLTAVDAEYRVALTMDDWCGTACCLAGGIALAEGWHVAGKKGLPSVPYLNAGMLEEFVRKGADLRSVRSIATQSLNICRKDAELLFDGDNSFDDLLDMRNHLAEHDSLRGFVRSSRG